MNVAELLPLEASLAQTWPHQRWASEGMLVAISGGPDSLALLLAFVRITLRMNQPARLFAAHFNHRLRGAESDGDQAFVEGVCRQWQVPLEIGAAPLGGFADDAQGSLENAARRARYGFLACTAAALGLRYVATGHTADDQAETIIYRIMRGTGLRGLGGMAEARPLGEPVTLIRPLLGFRRRDTLEYLGQLGQPYRVDSSNSDIRWTRNRIRHDLLPRLAADYNPHIVEALIRLGRLAREAHELIAGMVEPLWERYVRPLPHGGVCVVRNGLAETPPYLVRELFITVWRRQGWPLMEMGFEEWDALARWATEVKAGSNSAAGQDKAAHVFPGGIRAERTDEELRLTPCSGPFGCAHQTPASP